MGDTLKIGLIGYGRMGREVEQQAAEIGHQIIAKYDVDKPLSPDTVDENVDVFIDFSVADAVKNSVEIAIKQSKALVIGTTGWQGQLHAIKQQVKPSDIGVIYSANFSIGMNVFYEIVAAAARYFDKFEQYDPYVHELHHHGKADSPSGTAFSLADVLLESIQRKNEILSEKATGKIQPGQLHVSSTRAGSIPGTHLVGFDSAADSIELKHTARNRSGFALGAIRAAEWIIDKKGLFTMDDLLADILDE